jgi:hypothetical protein
MSDAMPYIIRKWLRYYVIDMKSWQDRKQSVANPAKRRRTKCKGTQPLHQHGSIGGPVWGPGMDGPEGRRPAHNTTDAPVYPDDVRPGGPLIQDRVLPGNGSTSWRALPLEFLAQQYSWIFRETRGLQRESRPPDPRTALRLRREARAETLREWKRQLTAAAESESPGRIVADAILPCFEEGEQGTARSVVSCDTDALRAWLLWRVLVSHRERAHHPVPSLCGRL